MLFESTIPHQSNEIRTLCRSATGSGFLFLSTTSNNRFRTFDNDAPLRYDETIKRRRAFFMRYKGDCDDFFMLCIKKSSRAHSAATPLQPEAIRFGLVVSCVFLIGGFEPPSSNRARSVGGASNPPSPLISDVRLIESYVAY